MQTGERPHRRCRAKASQAGLTYLWLLFAVALSGAALAALGTQWRTLMQREREMELEFRGHQIARALAAYAGAAPQGTRLWPLQLEELLEDRRGGELKRHLRRLYTDPFTGQADWWLITETDGGIRGVRSRSEAPALRSSQTAAAAAAPAKVSDKRFEADPPASAASAASAAEGPARRTEKASL